MAYRVDRYPNARRDCDTCQHNPMNADIEPERCRACTAPLFALWESGPDSPYPYEPAPKTNADRKTT